MVKISHSILSNVNTLKSGLVDSFSYLQCLYNIIKSIKHSFKFNNCLLVQFLKSVCDFSWSKYIFFNVTIRLANDGEIILLNLELNDKLELMCMNVLCKASMRFIIKIQIKLS